MLDFHCQGMAELQRICWKSWKASPGRLVFQRISRILGLVLVVGNCGICGNLYRYRLSYLDLCSSVVWVLMAFRFKHCMGATCVSEVCGYLYGKKKQELSTNIHPRNSWYCDLLNHCQSTLYYINISFNYSWLLLFYLDHGRTFCRICHVKHFWSW